MTPKVRSPKGGITRAMAVFVSDAFQPPGRIPSLDGLRAISILMVILSHAQSTRGFPMIPALLLMGDVGHLGVRVFFVISGFLITSLLLSELQRTGRISLRDFYLRRFFRIFPACYTYVAIIGLLAFSGYIPLCRGDLAHALTYTINYHPDPGRSWWLGHIWSLSVEEQFYLLWPSVLALSGRRLGLGIAAGVVLGAPLMKLSSYYLLPSSRPMMGESFQTVADTLAVGCLLAGVRGWLGRNPWYLKAIQSRWTLCIPAVILVTNRLLPHARFSWFIGENLLNLSIAIAIDWSIRNAGSPFGNLLNSRSFVVIGVLSYSIYLWQQPFLNRSSESTLATFPINVLATAVAAVISYLLVERPFLGLRGRISASRSRAKSATVPEGLIV